MNAPIIGNKVNDEAVDALIDALDNMVGDEATLYVGYPVAASADAAVTLPALLISDQRGLVCFDIVPFANQDGLAELKAKQRKIVLALKAKLFQYPDLAGEDDLAFKVNCVTYSLVCENREDLLQHQIVDSEGLAHALKESKAFPSGL